MSEKQLIGIYEIIEKIGSGGMATVYKAYHPRVNRYVALKVLHQMFLNDKNFVERFEREAKIAGKLDHPNIIPIYDFDVSQQQPFLVMKYVEGQTLKQRMQQAPLTLDEVQKVMRSICDALAYAHEQGVLHRDIKPSNIMISNDQTVYLTDFGLARMAHQGESTLSVDTMLGTPHYISPEQAQSEPLDGRTDVYAVGIILYELMTGRLPFTGDSAFAIVHQQIFSAPPLPSQLNPDIQPAVEAVLLKVLSKNPDDRYPTTTALYQAFDEALRRSGMVALDASRVERAEYVAQSISRHTPRGGRYQAVDPNVERLFINHDGSKSVIVPVLSGDDTLTPDLSIKEWVDVVIERVQNTVDDVRQQMRERSLEETLGESYQEIEGHVKQAFYSVQRKQKHDNDPMIAVPGEQQKRKHDLEASLAAFDQHDYISPRVGSEPINERSPLMHIDEKTDAQYRRGIFFHKFLFFSHFALFVMVVSTLFISQIPIMNNVILLIDHISNDIAIEIGRQPEQVSAALSGLAHIPIWLMVALGWGAGVITHGLNFLDRTLGFRHQQRKNRIHDRMTAIFGADWRNVGTPQVYHQVRKKVYKHAKKRVSFLGHLASVPLSLYAIIVLKPYIDPIMLSIAELGGLTSTNWAIVLVFLVFISIVIHGAMYFIEHVSDNDYREIKVQEAIRNELYANSQNNKRKNDLIDYPSLSQSEDGRRHQDINLNHDGVRLSEDGEFTDSFMREISEDSLKAPH